MKIYVDVINQKLKINTSTKNLVSGSQNFIRFFFNLDSDWDGLTVFAQFRQGDVAYNQYLDNENSVYLPSEITEGTVDLSLYGTGGTVRATVNYLTFNVDKNIILSNARSTEISTSLYEQLSNRVSALVASPAGSGGDVGTEVRDIHTGWDGTTYETAGDAVRNQAKNAFNGSQKFINNAHFSSTEYFSGDFNNVPNNKMYPIDVSFPDNETATSAHSPEVAIRGTLITYGRIASTDATPHMALDMQLIATSGGKIYWRIYEQAGWLEWRCTNDEVEDARKGWDDTPYASLGDSIRKQAESAVNGSGTFINLSRLLSTYSGDFDNFHNNRIYPINIDFSGSEAVSAGITASSAHAPLEKSGGTLVTFGRGVFTESPLHKNGDVQVFTTPDGDSWIGEILVREYWDGWNAWHSLTDSSKRVWKGLKISVLGDSISSYSGHSAGNAYYSSSKIPSVNSMWWRQVCKITGAEKLVVDAYASSCCAVASASWTSSITPAVDDSRCRALHTGSTSSNNRVDPDIILIALGLNDFQANVPLGSWDGHEALSSSDTATWRGAYANMLLKIHTEYPDALVFCLSPWFFVRGNAAGVNVNTVGNTYQDYEDAMMEICELMGGVYVDSNNFGFTRQNYSAQSFAFDDNASDGSLFHPNATGQEILGQSIAAAVRDKAIGYINWLKDQQGV